LNTVQFIDFKRLVAKRNPEKESLWETISASRPNLKRPAGQELSGRPRKFIVVPRPTTIILVGRPTRRAKATPCRGMGFRSLLVFYEAMPSAVVLPDTVDMLPRWV
jgi:hypothetical protein